MHICGKTSGVDLNFFELVGMEMAISATFCAMLHGYPMLVGRYSIMFIALGSEVKWTERQLDSIMIVTHPHVLNLRQQLW